MISLHGMLLHILETYSKQIVTSLDNKFISAVTNIPLTGLITSENYSVTCAND
jgi:hypothetical protein